MTTCSSLTDFRPSHNSDTSPRCHSTRSKPWVLYSSRWRSKSEIEMGVCTTRFLWTQRRAPVRRWWVSPERFYADGVADQDLMDRWRRIRSHLDQAWADRTPAAGQGI